MFDGQGCWRKDNRTLGAQVFTMGRTRLLLCLTTSMFDTSDSGIRPVFHAVALARDFRILLFSPQSLTADHCPSTYPVYTYTLCFLTCLLFILTERRPFVQ